MSKVHTLANIYDFQYGKGNTNPDNGGAYPVYGSNGIIGYYDEYNSEDSPVIGHIGANCGSVVFGKGKHFVTYNGVIATIKNGHDGRFGYYTLLSKNLKALTRGSAQPFISYDLLNRIKICLPDLLTQKKIADVLSALDAKIELNARVNAELESLAKTIYDYWFVQFAPHKSAGGKMVWNEELKREIPLGWEAVELSDIANITMGQSPPGESYNEDGEGMIFFQGATDFGNRFPSVRQFTTQPTRFAKTGDILLSVRAPVGTINIAKEDYCIGRGLAALNSKDGVTTYLFEVMKNLKQVFDRRNVNGTTFGSITKDDLFSLKVLKPEKSILEKYHKIISPTFEQQNKLDLESQALTEVRDWLLPLLMNGQVKV